MTQSQYRDTLDLIKREIACSNYILSLDICLQTNPSFGQVSMDDFLAEIAHARRLVTYRRLLVCWWYGSRIGNPPPFPG